MFVLVQDGIVTDKLRVEPAHIYPFAYASQFTTAPDGVEVGWSYDGNVYTPPAPPPLALRRAALIRKIDADIDAIYRAMQGDRGPEYTRAEAEAIAFKQAGYTGAVPDSVASWANAKAWTATQATDDILATATGWRTAQSAMRATRLSCKEIARTANDLTAVTAQWEAFLVTIKTALGIV